MAGKSLVPDGAEFGRGLIVGLIVTILAGAIIARSPALKAWINNER